jgi:hypothetical protein
MEGNKKLTRCASLSTVGSGQGTMDSCYADCEGEEPETKIHDANMTQAQRGWRGGTLAPLLSSHSKTCISRYNILINY